MTDVTKIVEYDKYCKDCRYEKLSEDDDPCFECLCDSVNVNSHKPTKWEEKK